jgi:Ca2+-binding RTX toxin-like protein
VHDQTRIDAYALLAAIEVCVFAHLDVNYAIGPRNYPAGGEATWRGGERRGVRTSMPATFRCGTRGPTGRTRIMIPGTDPIPIDPPIPAPIVVTFKGTNNNDVIRGNGFDNIIRGLGGNDQLFGLGGNDVLTGGPGADFMDGGTGASDIADYNESGVGVIVNLATGVGHFGNAEGDTLVNIEGINGSTHGDELIGDASSNLLTGREGDDFLTGGLGADFLFGGFDDTRNLLDGLDTANYADSPVGVSVNLATEAGANGNPIGRGFGGTAEGDTLVSIENLVGSSFNDSLLGNDFPNELFGNSGNDLLVGDIPGVAFDDGLHGDQGNDTLKGGGGADVLDGGEGIDTASYTDSPDRVVVSLITNIAALGDASGDQLFSIENLIGSPFVDDLYGDDGVNVLNGMAGNDTLKGFGGDDELNGNTGADTMLGGLGADTYLVDNAGDVAAESGGEGNDTVQTSVSYTLTAGSDIETLRTTNDNGTAAINLTGNANGNVVIGNNGSNTIGGGNGNDELTGRAGQDGFLFDTPLNAASNVDRITDFNIADDTILLDRDIFSSSLGLGNISAGEFVIGAAAQDANDRIIYNSATGALFYDSDGNGGIAQIQFATLSTGLALTNFDFFVVA